MEASQFTDEAPGETITNNGYATFNPNPLPPEIEFDRDLINKLSEARGAAGQLAGIGQIAGESRMLLLRPFIRREAVYSSRIEGTYATVSDVYAHEAGQEDIISRRQRGDVLEVHNYVEATEVGLEKIADNEMSVELIKELHEILLRDVRGDKKSPGEFRDEQNAIGSVNPSEARYVPPPPHLVKYQIEELVEFINSESGYDPLIDIALAHYQFESIHPFFDGNGRMGRLLITLMLDQFNLLPEPFLYFSSYFNTNRDEYIDCLYRVNTKGEWIRWLKFFLDGVIDQSRETFIRSRNLIELRDEYRHRYQDHRSEVVLPIVYDLFRNPVLTIKGAAKRVNTNYQPARRAIGKLEEQGVLEEVTGKDRYRVYQAPEIIDVIEKPIDELVDDVESEFEKYEGEGLVGQAELEDF